MAESLDRGPRLGRRAGRGDRPAGRDGPRGADGPRAARPRRRDLRAIPSGGSAGGARGALAVGCRTRHPGDRASVVGGRRRRVSDACPAPRPAGREVAEPRTTMLRCPETRQREPPPLLACQSPRGAIAVGRPERDAGTWRTRIAEARRDRARHSRARRRLSRGAPGAWWIPARRSPGSAPPSIIAVVAAASLPPAQSTAVPAFEPAPVAARFLDAVKTGHGTERPDRDRVRRADGRRVRRRRAADLARRPDQRLVGRRGPPPDDRPDRRTGARTPCTPSRSTRSARSEAGGKLGAPIRSVVLTARRRHRVARRHADARRSGPRRHRRSRSSSIGPSRSRPCARRSARRPRSTATCSRAPRPANTVFTPWSTLSPGARYRIWLDGLVDADGLPFEAVPAIVVSTGRAPSVVRFRPVNGTAKVERTAILSVRFTQPMQRTATAAAFVVDQRRPPRHRQDRLGRGRHGARVHAEQAARLWREAS